MRRKKGYSNALLYGGIAFSIVLIYLIFFNTNKDEGSSNGIEDDILMHHVKKIAVVRVVDTPAHSEVKTYIQNEVAKAGWDVELDSFVDQTPLGPKKFTNIIATLNPDAEKFVVLSAHYDSKLFHDFEFVAAFDSAASCSILIELAKSLKISFKAGNEWGLKIVFFDGEEALVQWTDKDSIYGAKHLAERWEKEMKFGKSMLSRINVLILLDLLGTENAVLTSRYKKTDDFFDKLVHAERELRNQGHINQFTPKTFLTNRQYGAQVQDDHLPFLNRDVPVVHLIPLPFPQFWHTKGDTTDKLHLPTMKKLKDIIFEAVLEHTQSL